jgi:Na+/H+ antiporter NhaD/arsenite permease-like protein
MLAMASTLAGNLTITGSVANIIVAESARQNGGEAAHISFHDYARVGVPVTVLTVAIGAAWLWWIG